MNITRITGLGLVLLFITACASSMGGQNPEAAPSPQFGFGRGPRIVSPEIHENNSVTFRLNAPEATEVTLYGDWITETGRILSMSTDNDTLWTITVDPIEPELWSYYFNVNGVKVLDPQNSQMKRDGVRWENILMIPGEASDLYIPHNVPHGTVSKVWYDSPTLGLERRLYVYTPPGYEGSSQRYPVFYLLHGAGGDEDAWTTLGRANHILDNLIARGEAESMIVVMTNGNRTQPGTNGEVAPPPEGWEAPGGTFEESLVNDVVPFIEDNYRTLTSSDERAIAGLSMGGGHTIRATLSHPTMFNYIGIFSSSSRDTSEIFLEQLRGLRDANPDLYWIGMGVEDGGYERNQTFRSVLDEQGMDYVYRESTGGHTWANWRIYLSEFAPLLFK